MNTGHEATAVDVTVQFPPEFDDRGEYEAERRGLLDDVQVRIGNRKYTLCFFVYDRLEVEIEQLRKGGQDWFAEPGLVIVPTVTRDVMQRTVSALVGRGYFERIPSEAVE